MNKFHRILSVILVFVLCFSLTPVSVLADEIAEPEWQEVISATQSVIDAVEAEEEEMSPEETSEPETTDAPMEPPEPEVPQAPEETEAPEESAEPETPEEPEETADVLQSAEVETTAPVSVSVVNPLYEGLVTMPEVDTALLLEAAESSESVSCISIAEAAAVLRAAMTERRQVINVTLQTTYELTESTLNAIFDEAVSHTGIGDEGDYLRWVYHKYAVPEVSGTVVDGVYTYPLTWQITYYTNAAQEAEMTDKVAQVIEQLELPADATAYEKIRAVYDYVCANVVYDNDNLNDSSYYLKFTAYAALIDGTAVCQGYAALVYRLLLELGVDSRLIAGSAGSVAHGWNIAELGNAWYNLDSTWDAGKTEYNYFLKGSSDFEGHTRFADYVTAEFHADYPMASTAYAGTLNSESGGETTEPEDSGETPEVTRAQWVQALVAAFEMTVEEDNYPDNYYSDISDADDFYRDIMVAVEFGVVDLDAGEAFRPNDAATREFAAQTLNHCLGFQLEEGAEYTYADTADVTYPDAVQVAVNRGWFALADGNFLPAQAITAAEKDAMLADAAAVLADDSIDEEYENTSSFADGVIVVPQGADVDLDAFGNIVITNSPVEIAAGDIFVVYEGDYPIAFVATEVVVEDGTYTIAATTEGADDAILEMDYEGIIAVDLEDFQGTDSTTFRVNDILVTESETLYGINYDKGKKTLTATKTITLGTGVKATISAEISDLNVQKTMKLSERSVVLTGDVELSTNVSVDFLELAGIKDRTIELGRVPILYGAGYVSLAIEYTLDGELNLVWTGDLQAGFKWTNSDGFRVIASFKKRSFTISAEVNVSIGLRLECGVDLALAEASIWAAMGAEGTIKATQTTLYLEDGTKVVNCLDMKAYMYARVGAEASIIKIKEYSKTYDIYTESNSPIRTHYHFENGSYVYACTLGDEAGATSSNYYTDPSSKNFNPGSSNGSSSYTNSSGANIVIYTYTLDEDENATITGYKGYASALTIPKTIDGYTVTAIGSSAFSEKTSLRSVVIPDTVTAIGSYAFYYCTNLTSIKLSSALTTIGSDAFYECTSLLEVDIPDSVTFIGDCAFYNCKALAEVTLSKNLIEMEYGAFMNCTALTEITIPKSLTTCGAYYWWGSGTYFGVFAGCTNLKTVHFEDGVTTIAANLFYLCSGLESIAIPDTVTAIGDSAFESCTNLTNVELSSALTTIGSGAFSGCVSLLEIEIPDTVTEMGTYAFYECKNLSNVKLSKNLKEMDYGTFMYCTALTEITIPKSLTSCGATFSSGMQQYYSVFYGCTNLKTAYFEEGMTEVPQGLFHSCPGLEYITIPDTVTVIESTAFYNCTALKEIVVPNAVVTIGESAFSGCTKLTNVKLSSALTTIESDAFYGCSSLLEIVIPDSVTFIGDCAFYNCKALAEVTLSKNLIEMEYGAFMNCIALTEITIPKSLTTCGAYYWWGSGTYFGVFAGCTNLKTAHFEEGVTEVVGNMFYLCPGLEYITIPDTVTKIGNSAFYNCTALKEIVIPDSVTSMGTSVFEGCTAMEKAVWPKGTTEVMRTSFYGCTSLKEVYIPDTVTAIADYAFYNCDALLNVTIPDSVLTIGEQSFYDCDGLTEIKLSESLTSIDDKAFYSCDSLTGVTVPDSVVSIGASAFYNCDALTTATLSANLKTLGGSAFYDCDALTGIAIPDSVTTLGSSAFYSCELLKDVTLGTGLTKIYDSTFQLCPALEEIVIPYRVTAIGNNAFNACTGLVKVTIPRSVTSVGTTAFSYPDRMVIYGVAGTYAETYATNNNFQFVDQQINAENVTLSARELTLNKGKTATLVLTVTPGNFTDVVSWKSSDESVATITEAGVVTAKGVGTATIKVVVGSKSASCKVTVLQPVTSIGLNKTSLSLEGLATYTLIATAYPDNANDKTITWSTSDASVATVDENGLVTAIAKGTATITAAAQDGSGVTRNCTVTVTNNGYRVTDPAQMESPHNYPDSCTDFWVYTSEGAEKLKVTFDAASIMEEGFDYLLIYDGEGNKIGEYTGTEMVGEPIEVPGDTVRIQLKSDDSGNEWGFKVSAIEAITHEHTWGEGVVTKEPTKTTEGERTYTCSGCGETKTEVIPMLAGDINGDDMITPLDMVVMMKHIVGDPDTDITEEEADFNNDGQTDILDVIRLMRYLAGHDVELQ